MQFLVSGVPSPKVRSIGSVADHESLPEEVTPYFAVQPGTETGGRLPLGRGGAVAVGVGEADADADAEGVAEGDGEAEAGAAEADAVGEPVTTAVAAGEGDDGVATAPTGARLATAIGSAAASAPSSAMR
ncbi:MAG TPA: hypothetical protein VHB69_06765 [Mycobacteriales bacterium]|nr:hypothetical protein [Mycobacteriales bacterium]